MTSSDHHGGLTHMGTFNNNKTPIQVLEVMAFLIVDLTVKLPRPEIHPGTEPPFLKGFCELKFLLLLLIHMFRY